MIRPGAQPIPFYLVDSFKQNLKSKEVKWGFGGLSEFTYYRTYARQKPSGGLETWADCVIRVTEGMFTILQTHAYQNHMEWKQTKAQKLAQEAAERMLEFKWLPPGRGLWMMGTDFIWKAGGAALNNPLGLDTEVLTKEFGWIELGNIKTDKVTVLSKLKNSAGTFTGGTGWFEASVSDIEQHPAYEITFKSKFGNEYTMISSENHRWYRKETTKLPFERVETSQLKVGDWLPRSKPVLTLDLSLIGAAHGFFFGDGTRSNGELHQFTDDNVAVLKTLFSESLFRESTRILDSGLQDICVKNLPLAWGKLPEGEYLKDKRYVYGFLAGYFAADGKMSGYSISSAKKEELEQVRNLFWDLGIETSQIELESTESNYSDIRLLYKLKLNKADLPDNFFIKESHLSMAKCRVYNKYEHNLITDIKKLNETKEVRCLTVPKHENFTINGFCTTSNCAFVSTENMDTELSKPFAFLMDMSMLGVGVGFDTEGAGTTPVFEPEGEVETILVSDDREGWVEAISCLIDSYMEYGSNPVEIDPSLVRKYGEPIKGFGGVASGPEPLIQGFYGIRDILRKRAFSNDNFLTSVDIIDIQNIIGKIVVAGNVRRTAEIAFAQPEDIAFSNMKNWEKFGVETGMIAPPELKALNLEEYELYNKDWDARTAIAKKYADEEWSYKFGGWRWASNNSILARVGMDYTDFAKNIAENGEPGFAWLDNMQKFGRMKDPANNKDFKARGGNPCVVGSTLVQTDKGYKKVSDLVNISFKALVESKLYNSTKGFWSTGVKPVFKVELDNGSYVIATDNHKILTKNRDWVEIRDLNKNDEVIINQTSSIWNNDNGTYEEGYLCGHVIGDGTFDSEGVPICSIWLSNGSNLLEYGPAILLQEYSMGLKHRSDFKGWAHSRNTIGGFNLYRLKNVALKEVTTKYNIYANNKKVYETGSKEFSKGLLQALYDTDGSIQGSQLKGVSIRLSQIDLSKLEAVQRLLLNFGVMSKIYKNRRSAGVSLLPKNDGTDEYKEYNTQAMHELIISNDSIIQFSTEIGFLDNFKHERLQATINAYKRKPNKSKFYSKVVSIKPDGKEEVYDCTVEEVHSFSANGIIVHNCLEQTLEPYELCCLVETFPAKHEDYWDYQRSLKFAYLYAKTVTLMATHWEQTNSVIARNRRIGCSQSGIQEAILKFGRRKYLDEFCDRAYNYIQYLDQKYSEWMGVPRSIKTTSVKPSGTISLVAGALPGIHYAEDETYYRTVRLAANSNIVNLLKAANYRIEPAVSDPIRTVVVYFPVMHEKGTISKDHITIWEQFANAVDMQHYWADNQVSITITFTKNEAKDVARALSCFDSRLKGVSLLPLSEHGYAQAPYIATGRQEIEAYAKTLLPIDFSILTKEGENSEANKFCDSTGCEI